MLCVSIFPVNHSTRLQVAERQPYWESNELSFLDTLVLDTRSFVGIAS